MASFRGILRKAKKFVHKVDPVAKAVFDIEKKLPGSAAAGLEAATVENVSSNPYKKGEASRFDIFAGGTELSKSEKNRKLGRAAGTAVAIWFGAGAAGAGSGSGGGAAASGAGGGAATTGSAAAGAGAAKSAGILGTGVTAGEAAVVASTLYATDQQKKAAKEAEAAMAAQSSALDQSLTRLRRDTPQTPSIDEARRRAEQSDAMRRRRGRRASILTGDTGVGYTPVSQRSLIGA